MAPKRPQTQQFFFFKKDQFIIKLFIIIVSVVSGTISISGSNLLTFIWMWSKAYFIHIAFRSILAEKIHTHTRNMKKKIWRSNQSGFFFVVRNCKLANNLVCWKLTLAIGAEVCTFLVPLWMVNKICNIAKVKGSTKKQSIYVYLFHLRHFKCYRIENNDIIIAMKVYLIQLNVQDTTHAHARTHIHMIQNDMSTLYYNFFL